MTSNLSGVAIVSMLLTASGCEVPGEGTEFLGSFTEDNITGTFEHWECLLLCFGEFSDARKFILVRQR